MSRLRWEEPPPRAHTAAPARAPTWTEQLRAKPGRWAVLGTGYANASVGTYYRKRWGPEGFEFAMRHEGDTFKLYARYAGAE
jgi:hypothetical protein